MGDTRISGGAHPPRAAAATPAAGLTPVGPAAGSTSVSVVVRAVASIEAARRCDVYRLGGSCGLFARWRISGPFDAVAACDAHLHDLCEAQVWRLQLQPLAGAPCTG